MENIAKPLSTRRAFRNQRTWETVHRTAAPIGDVLAGIAPTVRRVYLTGPRAGGTAAGARAWAMGQLPPGWTHDPVGHFLEGEGITLRYRNPDGRPVEVLRTEPWFGIDRTDYTAEDAAVAFAVLDRALGATWSGGKTLGTPGTTGRDLLLRSIPSGTAWPVLGQELQELIRSTTGQGRIQLLPRADTVVRDIAVYDGRLMYAAVSRNLPGGIPVHTTRPDIAPRHAAGRYRVRFTVPRHWRSWCACGAPGHREIGLLPVADPSGQGWTYPAGPGHRGTTWCDGAELHLAITHGWDIELLESVVWPRYTTRGPLDGWAERLIRLRETFGQAHAVERPTDVVRSLVRAGVRSILLHSIGALHGAPQRVTQFAATADDITAGVKLDLRREGDYFVWHELRPPAWREMCHPEWSSAIWAKTRARMLAGPDGSGALSVAAADVLAFRTDAIWITDDGRVPRWDDDGAPGRLRRVAYIRGEHSTPRTAATLLALRAGGH